MVWAVSHHDEFLEFNHFTIRTDHQPLVTLMSKTQPAKRLIDFAMRLSDHTFTISL